MAEQTLSERQCVVAVVKALIHNLSHNLNLLDAGRHPDGIYIKIVRNLENHRDALMTIPVVLCAVREAERREEEVKR